MLLGTVIAILVIAGIALGIVGFNKLRTADIKADEALAGIDVQLTRRADLIPNLVNTVKGYAEHERGVFDEVTKARAAVSQAASTSSVEQKAAAEARLDHALVDVFAVAEAYPDLKASTNFQGLQQELSSTEKSLAFARQYYNDAVRSLNGLLRTVPWMWFNSFAGVSEREFYEAPVTDIDPPSVQF